jgi:hypothetical protein
MIAALSHRRRGHATEHFGGLSGVTKRIASTTNRLFQNRRQLIHAVIPSGNSRADACASMREGR